ncbi:Cytochrome c oxidase subunit 6C [Papilio machaon]|uniref:Cytochrome c oxidase subunit 6C n=2 Tax=Papilio machaon TaxID=76193 RepID=A0A194QRZ5_PAPMA|nr:Cytochrome c oxidase subunit 6C [Papilio machaon]
MVHGWNNFKVELKKSNFMADKAVSTIAKPQMRGLLNNVIKRNLITAITLAAVAGFSFKQLVGNERKRRYAEFYRTYDAEKEFEEMRQKGLFQSC